MGTDKEYREEDCWWSNRVERYQRDQAARRAERLARRAQLPWPATIPNHGSSPPSADDRSRDTYARTSAELELIDYVEHHGMLPPDTRISWPAAHESAHDDA